MNNFPSFQAYRWDWGIFSHLPICPCKPYLMCSGRWTLLPIAGEPQRRCLPIGISRVLPADFPQFVIFAATVTSPHFQPQTSSHTHKHTLNLWEKTSTFIRLMHSCGKKNTFSCCFYDLLCARNVKLCIWYISYLSDLEVGREYFSSSLHDLWLLQKCEIEYMSISILPYDNISNWRDLGVWGGWVLHTQLVPGKMEMAAYQAEITLQAGVTHQ